MEKYEPSVEELEGHKYGENVTVRAVFIRHGEKVITQQTVTTALTDEGREQAKQFGETRDADFIKSYYSPTDRTEETARIISESSPAETKGVPRRQDELSFDFPKGGEFIQKVQQFRREALVPNAEEMTTDELERNIIELKAESPEEFNKRLKAGADKHTEYYLSFGSNKPEEGVSSPAEIASRVSKLLLHYIEVSKRLYSGSNVDLINVTHDVNVATFMVLVLRESQQDEDINIEDIGGSVEYTEECEIIIQRKNKEELSLKLLFRGKEYDFDESVIHKLAGADYQK
jgi:broad specificity phosphatase PhoE